jgi:hypothetical protein
MKTLSPLLTVYVIKRAVHVLIVVAALFRRIECRILTV